MTLQVIPSSFNKCLENVFNLSSMAASNNVSEVVEFSTLILEW